MTTPDERAAAPADRAPLVLIAEDEPDNQSILQLLVETLIGARTLVVEDGLQALAEVRRLAPDLVLLDLMMPLMDGYEVARALKAEPATAAIPIIAISALARPGDREEALAAGCDDFVRKPFELDALEEMIRLRLACPATP